VNYARRLGIPAAATMLLCAMLTTVAEGAKPVLGTIPTLETISSRLELTPEQQGKLRPIFEKRKSELTYTQLQLQTAATDEQEREILRKAKEDGEAFNTQVESVLTPTQKNEWREIRDEVREKARERIEEKRTSD